MRRQGGLGRYVLGIQSSKTLRLSPLSQPSHEGWLQDSPPQWTDLKGQPKECPSQEGSLLDPLGAPSSFQPGLLLVYVISTVSLIPSVQEPLSPGPFRLSPRWPTRGKVKGGLKTWHLVARTVFAN